MNPRTASASAAFRRLACLAVGVAVASATQAAWAQKKVPGELWRQTMTMEMQGMSMPGRTSEVCIPKGRELEAAARPEDPNCRIYDQKQSGNRFTAKMECTGKDAMRGTMETVSEGNRVRGTITTQSDGETMTMRFDTTRLGKACEAVDWSGYTPPPVAAAAPVKDLCTQYGEEVGKDSAKLAERSMTYLGPGALCTTPAQRKPFCDAVQTPNGYLALKSFDASNAKVDTSGMDEVMKAAMKPRLTEAVSVCGIGTGAAGVEKLRTRLLSVARERESWAFLIYEGDDATYAWLSDTAKAQCSGRSYTAAREPRYARLCDPYGPSLIRGDRAATLETASGGARGDDDGDPASGSTPAEEKPSPTNELLKKGRGVLRGILGGG